MIKKTILLIIILASIVIMSCGLDEIDSTLDNGIKQNEKQDIDEAVMDNKPEEKLSITIKDAIVISEDGWIYFCDFANRISRVRLDRTQLQILAENNEARTGDILVHKDWIYFANWEDDGRVYRLKTDGSELMKLTDDIKCLYIDIENEWVYYQPELHGMSRVSIDGSHQERIINNSARYISVNDNWIYYQQTADDQKRVEENLYKIKVDGTSRVKLNDGKTGYHIINEGWIYYKEWIPPTSERYETGGAKAEFYKIRIDGNERQILSEHEAKFVNIYNNLIYYANVADGMKLYRMKTNGDDNMKLNDEVALYINVIDDWIYYAGENQKLCRIKIDGTNREEM